ncbi:hypothetical protein CPLU01_16101 [Colletotrichum plurivorum]|uniref:Uncharacterized protein n=1 Tax=Colletotrichum plurivorum TaxID=2175906 RepID=A0A8H6IZL6_9PEZI|nr:hypothetical protein CPLU01_16101 [Colletotrichum plurivorum]
MFYSNIITLLASALAVGNVNAFTWTRCTNAEKCVQGDMPNKELTTGGGSRNWGGWYVATYDSCSGFAYDQKDGYWYSHEKDGLLVSPAGYMRTAHDCNLVVLRSKNSETGSNAWWKHRGGDCCLPDEVGTGIDNLWAYYTGDA